MSESDAPPGGRRAVVLAGGDPVPPDAKRYLAPGAVVVAADSGVHQAAALRLTIDVVVGDLDSVDGDALAAAVAAGATVEQHPAAKDATDLELALATALRLGAREMLVLGAGGGRRLDHFLGNVLLLAAPAWSDARLTAIVGDARVTPVHDTVELTGAAGDLVTLLAVGGTAHGVTTHGLQYPLRDEDLTPGSTRGVSNVLLRPAATVSVGRGTLLAVQPFHGEVVP